MTRTKLLAFWAGAALAALVPALGASAAASTSGVLAYVTGTRALNGSVEVAALDGHGARRLAAGVTASVAPDGGSVAVVQELPPRDDTTSNLVVYPSSGGGGTKLYHCNGFLTVYGWSPDSARILATCPTGLNQRGPLVVIDARSGATVKLASGVIEGASFSPSSGEVVYALGASQQLSSPVNLFTAPAGGGASRQLTHGGIQLGPLWGPNGIVYAHETSRGSEYAPINQIWIMRPNGSGARQLTHMPVDKLAEGLVPVGLSADGKHMLADFEGTDQSSAWAVDLTGARVVPRPLLKTMNSAQAISRDGSTVLLTTGFEGSPSSVESVPFGGGTPTVLAPHGTTASWNR